MRGVRPTKTESEVDIVFDIGSASIGGAILYAKTDSKPAILFSVRDEMPNLNAASHQEFFDLMKASLSRVAENLASELHKRQLPDHILRPTRISAVLASPWYASTTILMREENETPFTLDAKFVAAKVAELERSFEEGISSAAFVKEFNDTLVLIEEKIIRTSLNGYDIKNPFGKPATSAEFSIYVSVAAKTVKESIEASIGRSFPQIPIEFHSFSLVAFTMLRDMYPEHRDFLFLDINGEETEVTVVKRGIAVKNVSVPLGRNTLLRQTLAQFPDLPAQVALGELRTGAQGGETKLAGILKVAEEDWQEELREVFTELSDAVFLPRTLFFMADDDAMDIFGSFIRNASLRGFTLNAEAFEVIPVMAEKTDVLCDTGGNACTDPFIGIESAFIGAMQSARPQTR